MTDNRTMAEVLADAEQRLAACANACAGIDKPELAIPAARENLRRLLAQHPLSIYRDSLINETLKLLGTGFRPNPQPMDQQ